MAVAVGEMFVCSTGVPNSRFEEIYINDLRVLSETLLSKARAVTLHIGPLRIWALYKALYEI